ncbi:MAG: leucine-rich repeat domain-containing protein, partial [Clostridiales bacterium]|nr:leucine-rich repeat domain-containing protein [Clostridiales bacterium]
IQLVRNLNTALATDNKKHATMQSALDSAAEFGYDVAKINASATDNEILWDSKNDVFCYLKDGKIEYIPNSVADDDKLSVNSYLLWKISKTVDPTYSTYYTGDATTFTGENAITKGFDAGTTKGITAIEYENNTDQKVVIRTNSFDTTLTINDSSTQGKIYHYDNLGKLIITDCAMESYHEMGTVGYAELKNGHLAVEENASINLLFANPQDSATLKITNNGTITNAQASSDTVKESATISGVNFNRASGAVSKDDIKNAVQVTHQSNCEHANIVVSKAKDPTCTETGLTAGESCADCHKVFIAQEVVPATGTHTWGEGNITTPATCVADGVKTYTCSVCGATNTEVIPATGSHNYGSGNICTVCGTLNPEIIANGKLQNNAFIGNTSITTIVIPEGVTEIGTAAFQGCTNLTSVTIPNTVKTIGSSAFSGCTALTNITLPDGITVIQTNAFANSGLTSVEIPASVTGVASNAFAGCSDLTTITVAAGNEKYTAAGNCLIQGTTLVLGCKNSTIPTDGSVTKIGDNAFKSCSGLTSVEIPANITSIGENAFDGCSGLTSVKINAGVTSIGNYAFQNCTALTSIEIPNSVTSLGTATTGSVFFGCTSLTRVTLPNNTNFTVIPLGTFSGCTSLTDVTLPDSIKTIKSSAFKNCSSLTEITIPADVTEIGSGAFEGCTKLARAVFSGSMWKAQLQGGATKTFTSDLSDASKMAGYLTRDYCFATWKKIS